MKKLLIFVKLHFLTPNICVLTLRINESSLPQGCAYIRFHKPSEAFNALENCDSSYKAVMAEPRVPKNMMTMTNVKENQTAGPVYSQIVCPVPQGMSKRV